MCNFSFFLRLAAARFWVVGMAGFPFTNQLRVIGTTGAAALLGSAMMLSAQAQEAGGIRGVVLDSDFGMGISRVRVTVNELGRSAVTDANGRFTLSNLPPGVYTVTAAADQFVRMSPQQVSVTGGSFRDLELKLTSVPIEGDPWELPPEDTTPVAETKLDMEIQTKNEVVSILGEKLLSQMGSSNVGGALKAQAGTNIVDGKYVVVRGLADRYVNVLLNGGRVPSPDPDRRAVNVDIFPTTIVSSLATTKTYTPDQPGDSSGGQVDIRTRAMPEKFTVKLRVGAEYNTQTTGNDKFLTYEGAGTGILATADDRRRLPGLLRSSTLFTQPSTPETAAFFDKATRSLVPVIGTQFGEAPANYNTSLTIGDRINAFGGQLGWLASFNWRRTYSLYDFQRGRYVLPNDSSPLLIPIRGNPRVGIRGAQEATAGALFAVGFEPDEYNRVSASLMLNQNALDEAFFVQTDTTGTDSTSVQQQQTLHYVERSLQALQFRGEHKLINLRDAEVNWAFTAARARQDEPDYRRFENNYDLTTGEYAVPTNIGTTARRYWRYLDDYSYSAQLDFKIPLFEDRVDDDGKAKNYLKIGAAYDLYSRDYDQVLVNYNLYNSDPNLQSYRDPSRRKQLSDVFLDRERIGLGPGQEGTTNLNWAINLGNNRGTNYAVQQTVPAAYVMFDLAPSERIRTVFGARVEHTDIQVSSVGPPIPGIDLTGADVRRTDVLPAFAVTYDMTDDMKLRMAFSRTIARPAFKEIAPIIITEFANDEEFVGNPRLRMSTVDNYDIRWDWYPREGEVVSIGAFYKYIKDPIERFTIFDGESNQISNEKRNFPQAQVYGVEFELRKRLDQIHPFLENFTFGFNFSYMLSQVPLDADGLADKRALGIDEVNRRLEGQPDYTCNANLTYEDDELGLSATLFYNVTGPYLYSVGAGGSPDIFERPAPSLDFSLTKKFGPNWELTFRAKNLLDSEIRRSYDFKGREFIYDSYTRGQDYSLSLGFSW